MRSIIIFLACFVSHAYLDVGIGTPSQVVLNELMKDPKLVNFSVEFTKIEMKAKEIDRIFEHDLVRRNESELRQVLEQVKLVRGQAAQVIGDIRMEIAATQARSLFHRIFLESLRIQAEQYDKLLKWISLEILGDLSSVSKFENYSYSETVSIAKELLMSRFANIMTSCFEADKLIQESAKKSPKMDQATRSKVDRHLQEVLANATLVKGEITKDYYEEVERIRLENKELNLLQRMDFEATIDLLNFGSGFVKKYEELFLRIN